MARNSALHFDFHSCHRSAALSPPLTRVCADPDAHQLIAAAREGRANDMLELLGQGANIDFKVEEPPEVMPVVGGPAHGHGHGQRGGPRGGARGNRGGHFGHRGGQHQHGNRRGNNAPIGRTALTWAAENGRTDCVRLLLEAGADKEVKDEVRYVVYLAFGFEYGLCL